MRLEPASRGRDITWWGRADNRLRPGRRRAVGLSRSGSTIATGILLGDRRDKVASLLVSYGHPLPILGESLLAISRICSRPVMRRRRRPVCWQLLR